MLLRFFCKILYLLCCCFVASSYGKGCMSDQHVNIVLDSTKSTSEENFGVQKVFVKTLLSDLQAVTNLTLTVQVYHNENTCKALVKDHNKSFFSIQNKEIRSRLDSLSYVKDSKTSYDLDCVKKFMASLSTTVNNNKKNSAISSLIIASYDSVKDVIGGSRISDYEKRSNESFSSFLTTNGEQQKPYVRKNSDIQDFVRTVIGLICDNSPQNVNIQTLQPILHSTSFSEVKRTFASEPNEETTYTLAPSSSFIKLSIIQEIPKFTKIIPQNLLSEVSTITNSSASIPMLRSPYKATILNVASSRMPRVLIEVSLTSSHEKVDLQSSLISTIYNGRSSSVFHISPTVSSTSFVTRHNNTSSIILPSSFPPLFSSVNTALELEPTIRITFSTVVASPMATSSLNIATKLSTVLLSRTKSDIGSTVIASVEHSNNYSSFVLPSTSISRGTTIMNTPFSSYKTIASFLYTTTSSFDLIVTSTALSSASTSASTSTILSYPSQTVITSPLSTVISKVSFSTSMTPTITTIKSFSRSPTTNTTRMASFSDIVGILPSSSVIMQNSSVIGPVIPINLLKQELEEFINQKIPEESLADGEWVENFVKEASSILEKISTDNSSEILKGSVPLINYLEDVLVDVGKHMEKNQHARTVSLNGLSVEVSIADPKSFKGYQFTSDAEVDQNEGIVLPYNIFPRDYQNETAVIVAMTYKTLPVMQPNSETNEITKGEPEEIIADKVFVISVHPPLSVPFKTPFNYTIDVGEMENTEKSCVFWNQSHWSTQGCKTIPLNGSYVTCQCDHMTPFSVLMQVNDFEIPEDHIFVLSLITYIGCGLSILGCVILILAFMMCGGLIKIDRNMIHINLAFAIAFSNGLFIIADSVYKYERVCLGVSIAMLYTFLASFFWMLVEGMHVYLMVVKVFKSSRKMRVYYIIGWVLPAIIVTLAAVKYHENFTRPNFCWITTDHYLIWIFVGPALFVLSVNTVILIASLSVSHKLCIDEIEFNRLRKIARLTLVLMPIFGLSWVFGVLAVNKQLLVFQYIFTALNSFQGVFLFVCYCLMNSEVKREYQRVRRRSTFSSKSIGLVDSGFSSYVHYQRGRPLRSSALSSDDAHANLYLTKFDNNEDFYNCDDSNERNDESYPESVSNTLTKKTHKKNYSIELLRLPNTGMSDEDESIDDGDSTGLLKVNGNGTLRRSSSFHSNLSRNTKSNSTQNVLDDDYEEDDGTVYKTFQNQSDGTIVTAYQV